MRMALEWLLPSHTVAAMCTDFQSLLKAIQSGSADTEGFRRMLNKRTGKSTLLCVPDHHDSWIAGNGEVDASAKQAAAITDGAPRPDALAACKENASLRVPSAKSQQNNNKHTTTLPTNLVDMLSPLQF